LYISKASDTSNSWHNIQIVEYFPEGTTTGKCLILHHNAVAELDQSVGQRCLPGVVRNHDNCLSLVVHQIPQQSQDLIPAGTVEVAGWFIGEQQQRLGNERSSDGHALLLAAGELAGEMIAAMSEVHAFQRCPRPSMRLGFGKSVD
jgi:hypothetical protein